MNSTPAAIPVRYLPFQSDISMKQITPLVFFILLTTASCSQNKNWIVLTNDKYEIVDGKKQIVAQTVKMLRRTDSMAIKIVTKIFNYENDTRLRYSTGLSKQDGLQDYLMDSIFYNSKGNDTLKKSFVRLNNKWQPTQIFYKRFRFDNQVDYSMTERPFKEGYYFKKEIFYLYNDKAKLLTETEVECRQKNSCDSTLRRQYLYNSSDKLDSTFSYSWRNGNWIEIRRRNVR